MNGRQQFEEKQAIMDTIHQVARAFDQKLHRSLLPKLFTKDAEIIYWLRGTRMDFSMPDGTELFWEIHRRCYWTQHLVSPYVLDIDGDVAHARTPVHALHLQIRTDGSENHWVIGAQYEDTLVRSGPEWKIARRNVPCPWAVGDRMMDGVQFYDELPNFDIAFEAPLRLLDNPARVTAPKS